VLVACLDMQKSRPFLVAILVGTCLIGCVIARAGNKSDSVALASGETLYHGKPLSFWVDLLDKGDALDVEESIAVIVEIGPEAKAALPGLAKALKAEAPSVRFKAAIALWKVGRQGTEAVPALREELQDSKSGSRQQAIQIVTEIGPDAALLSPQLVTALADKIARIRESAADALEQIGPGAAPALAEGLSHSDAKIRLQCATILRHLSPSAAQAGTQKLTAALKDEVGQVRLAAAGALWRLDRQGDLIAPVLLSLLDENDKAVRKEAAELLCAIRPRPKEATLGFSILLKDVDPFVRVMAAWALWDIGENPTRYLPVLLELIKDRKAGFVRVRAAELLARMGPKAKEALPLLIEEVKSKAPPNPLPLQDLMAVIGKDGMLPLLEIVQGNDLGASQSAGTLLAALGEEPVQHLLKLTKHSNANVRNVAVRVIGMIGRASSDAVPTLIAMVQTEKDDIARATLLRALGDIGPKAEAAVPVLLTALKHKQSLIRQAAFDSLWRIGMDAKTLLPVLDDLTKDSDPYVRGRSVEWRLRQDGDKKKAVEACVKMLSDKPFRYHALDNLLRWFDNRGESNGELALLYQNAVPNLTEALQDTNPSVRRLAADCIARLGPSAKTALPALTASLSDKDLNVRLATAEAIRQLRGDGKVVVDAVLKDLQASDIGTATRAHNAIARFGKEAKSAAMKLREQLNGRSLDHRILAADTLAAVDPNQRETCIHVLLEALSSKTWSRIRAAQALCKVDGVKPRYLDVFIVALTDTDHGIRQQAVFAIADLASSGKGAANALSLLRNDEVPYVRLHAARALWKVGSLGNAMDALIAALKDGSSMEGRRMAAEFLGEMGSDAKDAVPVLLIALTDPLAGVRGRAAESLIKIDPQAAAKAGLVW